MASVKKEVVEGEAAPDFTLPSHPEGRVSLADFHGQSVVLYFYPKDNTPGCTQEACDFRDLHSEIIQAQAVVLGVSLDPIPAHEKFSSKFSLPFPLLSDGDAEVSKKYGVYKKKQMYGRTFWGIERSTFLIDPDGKIQKVFRKVKVKAHAQEVLVFLKGGKTRPALPLRRKPKRV